MKCEESKKYRHTYITICKPHGNYKPKIYNRYTQTHTRKKFKHNTKDRHQITREEKKRRKKQRRITKPN